MADSIHNDSTEIWKPIPGWEGLYSVSSIGRVRREAREVVAGSKGGSTQCRRLPEMIRKPFNLRDSYYHIILVGEGRKEKRYVHQFVCRAFHGPAPSPRHQVAHRDGNGQNNSVGNLRWATPAENAHDKILHGTDARGEKSPNAKISDADVIEIRRVNDWRKDKEFAENLGVKPRTILNIRLRWTRTITTP